MCDKSDNSKQPQNDSRNPEFLGGATPTTVISCLTRVATELLSSWSSFRWFLDPEDVAHDCFTNLLETGAPGYDSERPVEPYLASVVYYELVDRDRRNDHRQQPISLAFDVADERSNPVKAAESKERRGRVQAAVDRLSPQKREAVRMRHSEGLSIAEIAARTGRTKSAVQSCLWRVYGELRLLLKNVGPEHSM